MVIGLRESAPDRCRKGPGMAHAQSAVARVFMELASVLVTHFDLIDFLYPVALRSAEALSVEAVGLLLAYNNGEGRGHDCYLTGRPVGCPDLSAEAVGGRIWCPTPSTPGSPPWTRYRCARATGRSATWTC